MKKIVKLIAFVMICYCQYGMAEEVCGLTIGPTDDYKIIEPNKHPLYSDPGIRQQLDNAKFALVPNRNADLVLALVMEKTGNFPTNKDGIIQFYENVKSDILKRSPGVTIKGGTKFEDSARVELTIQRQISNDSTHVSMTTWYFQKPNCNIGLEVQAVYGTAKLSNGTPELTTLSRAFQNDIQSKNKGKLLIPFEQNNQPIFNYLTLSLLVIIVLILLSRRRYINRSELLDIVVKLTLSKPAMRPSIEKIVNYLPEEINGPTAKIIQFKMKKFLLAENPQEHLDKLEKHLANSSTNVLFRYQFPLAASIGLIAMMLVDFYWGTTFVSIFTIVGLVLGVSLVMRSEKKP